jgi:hypothetical protein
MTQANRAISIILSIKLLVIAELAFGAFTILEIQQANANNNNGDHKNSCNYHHFVDKNCSHDSTPFILPFP